MSLGPVAQRNKELITEKINKLIKSGTYQNISDIRKRNPSLQEFCFNNKYNPIAYSFSSQFTNENYLELLNELEKEMEKKTSHENQIQQTNIGDNVFVDLNNGEKNNTLIGVDDINKQDSDNETYRQEKQDKKEAHFQNINNIDPTKLSKEQLQDLSIIKSDAEKKDNIENTQVYFDEYGNMTNIVKYNKAPGTGEPNYYTVESINGEKELVGQGENSINEPSKAKVKVKTLSTGNISSAFTNTLILSFIIGSFFGIIFLAIYIKVMH